MRIQLSFLAAIALLLSGCLTANRVKGGATGVFTSIGTKADAKQSDDPKESTSQEVESEESEETILPAGTVLVEERITSHSLKDGTRVIETNRTQTVLSQSTTQKKSKREDARTSVGAAQKNDIGRMIAEMKQHRWIQMLGAVVFLFGIASTSWPPAKALVAGSLTTSIWVIVGGLVLIVLPPMFMNYGVHILGGVASVVVLWLFAHRHGSIHSEAKVLREFIDRNKNGIDDRLETGESLRNRRR